MKLKLWLRNLSVSAPRVAVRTQLPWALRARWRWSWQRWQWRACAVYHYARNVGVR